MSTLSWRRRPLTTSSCSELAAPGPSAALPMSLLVPLHVVIEALGVPMLPNLLACCPAAGCLERPTSSSRRRRHRSAAATLQAWQQLWRRCGSTLRCWRSRECCQRLTTGLAAAGRWRQPPSMCWAAVRLRLQTFPPTCSCGSSRRSSSGKPPSSTGRPQQQLLLPQAGRRATPSRRQTMVGAVPPVLCLGRW